MKNNPSLRLWGKPLLIGLLSITGLIAALVGDNYWDVYSWLALGLPVVIMIRSYYFPAKRL